MRFLAMDIETTGIDPKTADILELGVVLRDTAYPSFCEKLCIKVKAKRWESSCIKWHRDQGNLDYHLDLNYRVDPDEVCNILSSWFIGNGICEPLTVVGKNFGSFDLRFLCKLPGYLKDGKFRFHKTRIYDVGMAYAQGLNIPTLSEIITTIDYNTWTQPLWVQELKPHQALWDAWTVSEIVRVKLGEES